MSAAIGDIYDEITTGDEYEVMDYYGDDRTKGIVMENMNCQNGERNIPEYVPWEEFATRFRIPPPITGKKKLTAKQKQEDQFYGYGR